MRQRYWPLALTVWGQLVLVAALFALMVIRGG